MSPVTCGKKGQVCRSGRRKMGQDNFQRRGESCSWLRHSVPENTLDRIAYHMLSISISRLHNTSIDRLKAAVICPAPNVHSCQKRPVQDHPESELPKALTPGRHRDIVTGSKPWLEDRRAPGSLHKHQSMARTDSGHALIRNTSYCRVTAISNPCQRLEGLVWLSLSPVSRK